MKTVRIILKIAAVAMAAAAVVCAVVAYWDSIMDLFDSIADKVEEKKANSHLASEYDDYDDEEIELYQ